MRIIGVRTAQVGGVAGILLAGLAAVYPSSVVLHAAIVGGIAVTVGLSVYFARTFNPRTTFHGYPLLVRLREPCGNTVALTFDDGPHPDTTPRILDALAVASARATFFVVGERATQHPELVRRMVEEGHTVGVHGLRHRTMVLQSAREIERDLEEAVKRIEAAAGISLPRPLLLRPPYGFKTWTLARTAHRLGFAIVAWSLDPRDYDPTDIEALTAKVVARLGTGDIVLLHERPELPVAADVLPRLLDWCDGEQLSPVGLIAVADFLHHPPAQAAQG
jgi:peptidoglycan/xylan/chitin deacetylase (PgdA/CDA1 family)